MAHTALVAPELTPGMVAAGEQLVRTLDVREVPVPAAFWILRGEETGWRLVIASPAVDTLGQLQFYSQLAEPVGAMRSHDMSMSDVVALSPQDPLVRLLRSVVNTGPGISGIRFIGNVINGVLIPDAHIYRLA